MFPRALKARKYSPPSTASSATVIDVRSRCPLDTLNASRALGAKALCSRSGNPRLCGWGGPEIASFIQDEIFVSLKGRSVLGKGKMQRR